MRRLILTALALSFLAIPTLQTAQAAQFDRSRANVEVVTQKKDVVRKQYYKKPVVVQKKIVVRKSPWARGQKYASWKRHQAVRDYNRYGLRRPGPGQEWIRVGNDYLLVAIASGIIAGAIAGH